MDIAIGRPRPKVAQEVGGEHILQGMILDGSAIAYEKDGAPFVRLIEHKWTDVHTLSGTTQIRGQSTGTNALGDFTLDSLTDFFSNTIERVQSVGKDVLDISDPRILGTHTNAMNLAIANFQQLSSSQCSAPGSQLSVPFFENWKL